LITRADRVPGGERSPEGACDRRYGSCPEQEVRHDDGLNSRCLLQTHMTCKHARALSIFFTTLSPCFRKPPSGAGQGPGLGRDTQQTCIFGHFDFERSPDHARSAYIRLSNGAGRPFHEPPPARRRGRKGGAEATKRVVSAPPGGPRVGPNHSPFLGGTYMETDEEGDVGRNTSPSFFSLLEMTSVLSAA
jgi:hypothetical protein